MELARDIHDQLGQAFTGLKIDLSWLEKQMLRENGAGSQPLREKVHDMQELIDASMPTVHRLVSSLRPTILDDLGLEAALEWQGMDFRRRTGISFHLQADCGDLSLDKRRSTILFRVFQEVLTNIARHAEASEVQCDVVATPSDWLLVVSDNGRGISPDAIESLGSLGLLGIRERLLEVDGSVEFRGARDCGTTVSISVPSHSRDADD